MPAPRILYVNHDNLQPSGGMRTIYSHVRHLVRNGLSAFVLHCDTKFTPRWFKDDVPTIFYGQNLVLRPDDIVIMPEDHIVVLDSLKSVPVKKVIFCQNHFYIFSGLQRHRSWQDLGITSVFASSKVIADFLQTNLDWPNVPVVPYAIDRNLFKPLAKKLQIAYMPRKRALEAEFIYSLAMRTGGNPANVPLVAIDGVTEAEAAKILGESAIFLSMSYLEGFGLPPLEAMASGCAVVGFHGYGGLDFATPANGFWCEEGNPIACVQMLRDVVEMVRDNSPELQQILTAAANTAACYTSARQEQELLQFVRSVLPAR